MTTDVGRAVSFGTPRLAITGLVLMLMLMLFAAPMIHADTTIFMDPVDGFSGDQLDRGFYISSYPGTNLSTVTLAYSVNTPGVYTTTLTARLGTFNGPIIGTTRTATTTLGSGETLVTYYFGGVLVPTGSVVTFTQQLVSGPDNSVYFDTGISGPPGITETEETTPPLDTFRRDSVGVTITQRDALPPTPVPSSLILMLTGLAAAGLYSARKRWQRV